MTPKKIIVNGQVRWQIRAEVGTGGKRKQVVRRFDTEREAKAELLRIGHEQNEGVYVHRDKKMTIKTLVAMWAEANAPKHKGNTVRSYEDSLRRLVELHGDLPVMDLTDRHLIKIRDGMLDGSLRRVGVPGKPMSPTSVNAMLSAISGLLTYGQHKRVVVHNVANPLSVPRAVSHEADEDGTEDTRRSAWADGELRKFRVHTADDRLAGSWALTAQGLRRGEVVGMKWSAIDFEASTVTVRTTVTYTEGKDIVGTPKSKKSRRTLKMGPQVMEALERQREKCPTNDGWITVDEAGVRLRTERYSDFFRDHVKDAGLPSLTLHGARHAVATTMSAKGIPLADIAAWLGQDAKDLAVTLGYIHAGDASGDAIRDALGA